MPRQLIDDPAAIHRNRELMHAPWSGETSLSLDGVWDFHLASRPEAVPAGSELPAFAAAGWARLPVPSNWEVHGHGEPIYQNIAYPFVPADYPAGADENPTGCYRTSFELPADWAGQRVFLEFGSVDSSFHCWVNGVEVGFSTDSKLPAHFDITAQLKPGRNHLAVRVYRWGSSSYLEKQDYWHLSGIQRSVRLIAKPQVHLRDWAHQVRFDAAFRDASVQVRAWISRPAGACTVEGPGFLIQAMARGYSVGFSLRDGEGREVAAASAAIDVESPMYGPGGGGFHQEALSARAELAVPAARAWTAETPQLYTLAMELKDAQGVVVDRENCRVGLRQLEIRDGIIRLNGQRLVFRGVNRHEYHPERGRAVTREDMREDLLAMKRLNFNAVRTCHYPDADGWYELCDELGMYVIDEANLETHGMGALSSRDPVWAPAYLERALRMCLRDRNHACVVAWSLGNESHVGPNHAAMANWLRSMDPSRPVQYESGFPGPLVSDIMVPMYPALDWVRQVLADPAEKRPMVMCEYAYGKGNSTGNVKKFWDLIFQLPRFQGGFMWDWRDKPFTRTQADGSKRWDYGVSRFEPKETERMCLNGIVGPDLVPHPGAWELAQAQSPVQVWQLAAPLYGPAPTANQVRVANRHQFVDLSGFRLRYRIADDGRTVTEGVLSCPALPPGGEQDVQVPLPTAAIPAGAERVLSIAVERIAATPWAEAGHAITTFHVDLARGAAVPATALTGDLAVAGNELSGAGFRLRVGADGLIAGLAVAGRELLTRPLAPCVSRAPTDIDLAAGGNGLAVQWSACGLDQAVWQDGRAEIVRLDQRRALVRSRGVLAAPGKAPVARVELDWTVHGSGDLVAALTISVDAAVDTIPRIGLATGLAGADRRLHWLGRGPHENYPDRKDSAGLGLHEAAVADLLTPYIFPQECGLRCDVRWLAVVDRAGVGLLAQGQPLLHASALPVRLEDLRDIGNLADLRRRDETSLHLDGYHMGLGGDTGWTRNVHPEFRLLPGTYRMALRLRVLTGGEDHARLGRELLDSSPH